MSEMTEVDDAYIDDLRDTLQIVGGFLWLYATLAVQSVFLTALLLLAGVMLPYWSLALHPEKCRLYVGSGGFRWVRT
jgi:hypothetical protein